MDTFSQVTLDRLMEKVAIERETAIKQLVDQAAIEGKRTIEEFLEAIEQVEAKGSRWVTYSFLLGIALILIFLVGAVFAMLTYRYVSQRMFESPRERRVS
jgi:cytochrome c-type biogenesis protein CcmH/NrfG